MKYTKNDSQRITSCTITDDIQRHGMLIIGMRSEDIARFSELNMNILSK